MTDFLRSILSNYLPDWLIVLIAYVVAITIILLVLPAIFMIQVWFERRIVARMQDRLGPNRVGPAGLLQSVADGVKMFTKEDIVPRAADRWVHLLAPIITAGPVLLMYAVLPWARGVVPVDIGVAILFVLSVSSVSAVGLLMAGWASNNKFALLGAMRAVAQMVSYEIPAVFALLAAVLVTGTMSLAAQPELQGGLPVLSHSGDPARFAGLPDLGLGWFAFTPVGLLGFLLFFIAALAEGERTPFDIPEADSEIVAGYLTEYSGMKFALFYLGQFLLNYALSMIAATVFLGGWQGPGVAQLAALSPLAAGALSAVYFQAKVWFLFFVMVWLRGAFPRLRVDQLMGFAWKFLIPLALVNILSAALWVVVTRWGAAQGVPFLDGLGPWARQLAALGVTAAVNIAAFLWVVRLNRAQGGEADLAPAAAPASPS
jgi:NADH-quinone oxidoreductase subunit H